MSRFQAPRGMRDLTPEIAAAFDVAAASIAGRALRYGYARLETPAIEDVQVFIRSSGETSDVAGKEMYEAVLHGEGGLALRPEGTAPVARAYLEHGMHRLPQPVRLFYLETMWRGQRPQLGRWRQFWSEQRSRSCSPGERGARLSARTGSSLHGRVRPCGEP